MQLLRVGMAAAWGGVRRLLGHRSRTLLRWSAPRWSRSVAVTVESRCGSRCRAYPPGSPEGWGEPHPGNTPVLRRKAGIGRPHREVGGRRLEYRHARSFRSSRRSLGLTQAELARRLDVATNTVARWERGVLGIRRGVARRRTHAGSSSASSSSARSSIRCQLSGSSGVTAGSAAPAAPPAPI
jgi:hypothetical protein